MGLLSTFGAASGRAFGFTRSAIAAATDAFFNRVTLLLPGNGTNGAQNNTFLDSSSNAFSITRNGNTTQGTFSPFSQTGWSNYFNGSSDYFSFADATALELGSGDFTLEAWVNFSALPASNGHQATFFSKWSGATTQSYEFYLYNNAGTQQLYFTYSLNSTSSTNIGAVNWTPSIGVWYHIACVRSGSNVYFFVNGAQQGSTASISGTIADNASTFQIGSFNATANTYLNGYLSNARVTKGGALYTSNFTPSTTPLTTTVSAGTVSLLTCQANRFVDNSSNAFTITVNGTPSVQAFSPFAPTAAYSAATNGGSGYFDGTGDYLSVASATALQLTNEFTVESWIYPTSFPSSGNYHCLVITGNNQSSSNALGIFIGSSGGIQVYNFVANSAIFNTASGVVLNSWNHIAVTRNSSNAVNLWLNGVSQGSAVTVSSSFSSTSATLIGASNIIGTGISQYIFGYTSNVRILKGTALYTAAFTPPTSPLTNITNTSLLLNYTNAGITDATAKNVLETVGNAQISTTQSKFGGSSMYFDGTGDWLLVPSSQNFNMGTGDWTVECWAYASDNTARGLFHITSGHLNASATGIGVGVSTTAGNPWRVYHGTTAADTSQNLSSATWIHVAFVRSGSSVKLYINGTSVYSATDSSSLASYTFLTIGAWYDSTFPWKGYIDDLRITKGYARYTANFTPTTAAFPVQ